MENGPQPPSSGGQCSSQLRPKSGPEVSSLKWEYRFYLLTYGIFYNLKEKNSLLIDDSDPFTRQVC